jgi:hypothetical protein
MGIITHAIFPILQHKHTHAHTETHKTSRPRAPVVLCGHSNGYLHLVHVRVRDLARVDLPQDHTEAEDVCLAVVPLAACHQSFKMLLNVSVRARMCVGSLLAEIE